MLVKFLNSHPITFNRLLNSPTPSQDRLCFFIDFLGNKYIVMPIYNEKWALCDFKCPEWWILCFF